MDYFNCILDAPKQVSSAVLTPNKYLTVRLGGNGLIINNLRTTVSTWTKTTVSGGYLYTKSFDVSKYGKILELGSYYITNSKGLVLTGVTASISSNKTSIVIQVSSSSSVSSAIVWYVNVNAVYTDVPMLVKSDTSMVIDYDALANNYIDSLSNLTIALSGDNLNITFTPMTDTTLLNAVDNGDTYIRLQLLVHQPSGYMDKNEVRGHIASYNNPTWLDEPDYSSISDHGQGFPYVRRRSHEARFYGKTWLNLSKAQLQAGSATLTDMTYAFVDDGEGAGVANDVVLADTYHVRVEMFCPALYRKGKDVFYYERNNHRKISKNRIDYGFEK